MENQIFYFLAHTGRFVTHERTLPIKEHIKKELVPLSKKSKETKVIETRTTNSFITFTEYAKTMSIYTHILIVSCLKTMNIDITKYVQSDVNNINTMTFENKLFERMIRILQDNIVSNIKNVIKPKMELSIRECFIYNEYLMASKDIINTKKIILQMLDVFVMECIHNSYIPELDKKYKKLVEFTKSYNTELTLQNIRNNLNYVIAFDWNTVVSNIGAYDSNINISILNKLQAKYEKIYSMFTLGETFRNILKHITKIDIKIYKKGMTMPNLKFDFNGTFSSSQKVSSYHKMGLYKFNEVYDKVIDYNKANSIIGEKYIESNIPNVSRVIPNEAFGLHGPELWATNEKTHASFQIAPHTNDEVKEEILRKVNKAKNYILDGSMFPTNEQCVPEIRGPRNKIMYCPSTLNNLIEFVDKSNITNSIFFLFGCSPQPIKKNPDDQLLKTMELSRQISQLGQEDFSTMSEKIRKQYEGNIIEEIDGVFQLKEKSVVEETHEDDPLLGDNTETERKYLKYKMKYLLLKKYINKS
jgi:hypothetical protein